MKYVANDGQDEKGFEEYIESLKKVEWNFQRKKYGKWLKQLRI